MRNVRILGAIMAAVLVCSFGLVACGGSKTLKDGTYTAQSAVWEGDEDGNGNGYGVLTVTITDGIITDAEFLTYEPDGTLKDENYGKSNDKVMNADFYNKAQRAVAASTEYGKQLVEVGSPDGVELISGATISYNEFQEAAGYVLEDASK